ncbi:MAG: hypothetical protein U0354_18370 [Candidatus Sericytochromatia bacterium]
MFVNNVSTVARLADKKELDSIKNAQRTDLKDNVVDATKEGTKTLEDDLKGAVNSGKDLYLKTERGIVKIDKNDMAATINQLRENLNSKESYTMINVAFLNAGDAGALAIQFRTPEKEINTTQTQTNQEQKQPIQNGQNPVNKPEKQPTQESKEAPQKTEENKGALPKPTAPLSKPSFQFSQNKTEKKQTEMEGEEAESEEVSSKSGSVDLDKKEATYKQESKTTIQNKSGTKETTEKKFETTVNKDNAKAEYSSKSERDDGVNNQKKSFAVKVENKDISANYKKEELTKGGDDKTQMGKTTELSYKGGIANAAQTKTFKGKVEGEEGAEVEIEENKTNSATIDTNKKELNVKHQGKTTTTDSEGNKTSKENKADFTASKDGVKGEVSQVKNTNNGVVEQTTEKKAVLDGDKSKLEYTDKKTTQGGDKDTSWTQEKKATIDKTGASYNSKEQFRDKTQNEEGKDVLREQKTENNVTVNVKDRKLEAKRQDETTITDGDNKTVTKQNVQASIGKDGVKGEASKSVNANNGVVESTTEKKAVLDGDKSRLEYSNKSATKGGDKDTFLNQEEKGTIDKTGASYASKQHFKGKVDNQEGQEVTKEEKKETTGKVDWSKGQVSGESKNETEITENDGKTTKTTNKTSGNVNLADGTIGLSHSSEKETKTPKTEEKDSKETKTKTTTEFSAKGKSVDGEKNAGAEGSIGRNDTKVSIKGDYTVTASKPKQNEDGTWSITWSKQLTAKVGLSHKQLEAGVHSEGAEVKTKKFANQADAEKFYKNPPLTFDEKNLGNMQVGESSASSSKSGLSVERKATDVGKSKVSGKLGLTDGRSVSISRTDKNIYKLEVSSNKGYSAGASLEGKVGAGANISSEKGKALTFTIDSSTPEGAQLMRDIHSNGNKAVDKLVKEIEANPTNPPKGVKVLSQEDKDKKSIDGKLSVQVPVGGFAKVGASLTIGKEVTATVKKADNDTFEIDLQKKNTLGVGASASDTLDIAKAEASRTHKDTKGIGIIIDAKTPEGKELISLIKSDAEKGMTKILDYMKEHKGQVPKGVKLSSQNEENTKEMMATLGITSFVKLASGSTQTLSSKTTIDKEGNRTDINKGGQSEKTEIAAFGMSASESQEKEIEFEQINGILKTAKARLSRTTSDQVRTNKEIANFLGMSYDPFLKNKSSVDKTWDINVSFTKEQFNKVVSKILEGKGPSRFIEAGTSIDSINKLQKDIIANKDNPVAVAKAFANFMQNADSYAMRPLFTLLEKDFGYKKSDFGINVSLKTPSGAVTMSSSQEAFDKLKATVEQCKKDIDSPDISKRVDAKIKLEKLVDLKELLLTRLNEGKFPELPSKMVELLTKQLEKELAYLKANMPE